MIDPSLQQFGENLKHHRMSLQLTQAQLAARTGLSVSFISMLERGSRQPPLLLIKQLGAAMGISGMLLLRKVL